MKYNLLSDVTLCNNPVVTDFSTCCASFAQVMQVQWIGVLANFSLGPGERGTHLKGGYRCGSQDPLFMPPAIQETPIEAQVCSQDPLVKEKCNFFYLESNLQKYGNFQLQKLKFGCDFHQKVLKKCNLSIFKPLFFFFLWKSAHKPPLSWQFICSQASKFGNLGCTYLPGKKAVSPLQVSPFTRSRECFTDSKECEQMQVWWFAKLALNDRWIHSII